MDRKINVKIGGRTYSLTAATPQHEEEYRLAAEAINRRLDVYTQKNPGRTMLDLMSMVALNEAVCRIDFQREIDRYKADLKALEGSMERYIKENGTKG